MPLTMHAKSSGILTGDEKVGVAINESQTSFVISCFPMPLMMNAKSSGNVPRDEKIGVAIHEFSLWEIW